MLQPSTAFPWVAGRHWPYGSILQPVFSQILTIAFRNHDSGVWAAAGTLLECRAEEREAAQEVAGEPRSALRARTATRRRTMEWDMTFSLPEAGPGRSPMDNPSPLSGIWWGKQVGKYT